MSQTFRPSKLFLAQAQFARMVPRLIDKAHELGYVVKGGDWLRDERCNYGSKSSRHHRALAVDLNLFRVNDDGTYTYLEETEDHRELGEWWEKQGGIWGGPFDDGNHYEWPMTPIDEARHAA